MEDEDWLLLLGFHPFILFDNRKKDSGKQVDLINLKESEKDILIDLLKPIEGKYKKAKIIKKSKELVNETLIKKIKG